MQGSNLDPVLPSLWLNQWLAKARLRNPDIDRVLQFGPDQIGAASMADPTLGELDRWIARNLPTCFDHSHDRVLAFAQTMGEQPGLMRSGVYSRCCGESASVIEAEAVWRVQRCARQPIQKAAGVY